MSDLITLTIDGRTAKVPRGTNLVEAAKTVGIEIPVFCYHPKLEPAGLCRMCLVQIEKAPKPQAACVTLASEGQVVTTNSSVVDDLRRGSLEFLLVNHPLDCPVCDKGGECDLQDLTFAHGPATSRVADAKIHKPKAVDLGNFIVLDNERCILCRRCVRFDDEIATEGNLIVEERAHYNQITTLEGERYDSYFSGNTIELCPVGALTSETYRFQARPWDLARVDSVCTGCSVGCNTTQDYRFGKLLRLVARENPAIDNGWLCDRGRFNYGYVQNEIRITQPLLRKDGQLVPATWTEAFGAIGEQFKAVKAKKGGKGIGVIGGGKLTNEEAYLLQKFARLALGTNNVDHRVDAQVVTSLGGFPAKQADLSDATAILVVDTDPAQTAPIMDLRVRKMADKKKAKIALLGSVMPTYRGRHARVQVKPGLVAAAVAQVAAVAAGKKVAGPVDAEAAAKLVELLAGGKKVVIVWGGHDAAVGKALVDLGTALKKAASSGDPGRSVHVLIPGAQNNSRGAEAMGVLPNFFPGYLGVADAKARETVSALWGARALPEEAGLTTGEMLQAAAAGEIKALYLAGANLMNTYPDRTLAAKALEKAFVVAVDLFLNETVAQADVVLPAAVMGEKAGTYTSLDGIVQAVKVAKKPEGAAQPDGDILVGLASAMGIRLAASPAETNIEIAKLVVRLDGATALPTAPAALLPSPAAAATAPAAAGLLLVPVARLYAGGSTARFDEGFAHVLPEPAARLHPVDAAALGLKAGEVVELVAGEAALRVEVQIDKSVVPGTVQAIAGLAAAPVNALTQGTAPVAATLAKLAVEVAD